jgi:hypothetical protein
MYILVLKISLAKYVPVTAVEALGVEEVEALKFSRQSVHRWR